MRLNNGFLLIEVLVALVVFCVMVSAFSWFINVWLVTDAEARARNCTLVQVCQVLERCAGGLGEESQETIIKGRQKSSIQKLSIKQLWTAAPQWINQLSEEERPRAYQVTATALMPQGKRLAVQVNG